MPARERTVRSARGVGVVGGLKCLGTVTQKDVMLLLAIDGDRDGECEGEVEETCAKRTCER
jgi:hypothetical protein